MMLPTSRRYIEQAFSPRVFAGLRGQLRGMGASPTAAEVSALAAAAADGSAEDVAAYRQAITAYYAEGGTYDTAASVQTAEREPDASMVSAPREMSPPMLYAAEECDIRDGACIARNAARQNANLALLENARRAFNLQVCEANAAMTPGTAQDQPCTQFREQVPVPAASGTKQPAVCSGGQCYTPVLGDTGATTQAQQAVQQQYASQYTPSGVARTQVGVPNQTVPPRPQPGEVPATAYVTDRSAVETLEGEGIVPGVSNTALMLGAAALVGVFLMARKG